MNIIESNDIAPYVSVVLFRNKNGEADIRKNAVEMEERLDGWLIQVLKNIKINNENKYIKFLEPYDGDKNDKEKNEKISFAGLFIKIGWFTVEKYPSWFNKKRAEEISSNLENDDYQATFDEIKEVHRHILVLAAYKQYVALLCDLESTRDNLTENITDKAASVLFNDSSLELVPYKEIKSRFIVGNTRNAYLNGLHAMTEFKADKKILMGLNLKQALDFLADQTFWPSTVVSEPEYWRKLSKRVGVSQSKHTVWVGPSKDFSDFTLKMLGIFKAINEEYDWPVFYKAKEEWEGFEDIPVLAIQLDPGEIKAAESPFELTLDPDIQWEPGAINVDLGQKIIYEEIWQDFGHFEITGWDKAKNKVETTARFNNVDIAKITFMLKCGDRKIHTNYRISKYIKKPNHEGFIYLDTLLRTINKRLKIRYDSGHVLDSGMVFEVRYRNIVYENVEWFKFNGFSITKEKPCIKDGKSLDAYKVGKDDSLFSFVVKKASALFKNKPWLMICDDGPYEIADFIIIEEKNKKIYFIHIKASKSADLSRLISIGAFEVVVSQAMKNLMVIKRENLAEILEDRIDVNKGLVWASNKRRKVTRQDAIDVIEGFGQQYTAEVIILQPHLMKSRWKAGTEDMESEKPETRRIKQLSTLLNNANERCRSMGAKLRVWGEGGVK